jgi:hypothetical protein
MRRICRRVRPPEPGTISVADAGGIAGTPAGAEDAEVGAAADDGPAAEAGAADVGAAD